MSEIFPVIGLSLITCILAIFLKESRMPVFAVLLSLVVGIIIFLWLLPKINIIFAAFNNLAQRANINQFYLSNIFKIIALGYVAEFSAQICRDGGQGALAVKVEFAAKVLVMLLAIPIVVAILESVLRILS